MAMTLSPSEAAQLAQTIEMFEVITQSEPNDHQSLEILKEAYSKLGRDAEVVATSKRIAQAYVLMGQYSSAILEYETILQRVPNDPDVQAALAEIENKSTKLGLEPALGETAFVRKVEQSPARLTKKGADPAAVDDIEDGRQSMHKLFVEGKIVTAADFELCWRRVDLAAPVNGVIEPFIQLLADRGIHPVEKSIKLLTDRTRMAFLPLERYDIDIDLARNFPSATCRRWCVLPFDRMSKSVLVATANPFNQQAAKELAEATKHRLLWYLTLPADLVKILRKTFR